MTFAVLLFLLSAFFEGLSSFAYYSSDKTSGGEANKLLLILVDGCRWDYPDEDIAGLPGFRKLAENGVRAPYVTPIFPSNSYPNWYTIVTGLYAESHGFIQNMMYDSHYEDFFLMSPNDTASVPHWWDSAEPLWITAEKNGYRSALYWWDGCQVEIRGRKPKFCRKYKYVGYSWPSVNEDTKEGLMSAMQMLESDDAHLVQIYYEPVDYFGRDDEATTNTSTGSKGPHGKNAQYYRDYRARKRAEQEKESLNRTSDPSTTADSSTINVAGHKYGPNSYERKQSIKDIDNLLDLTQREMERRGLDRKVNLVVVSDHGMTSTDSKFLNVINLHQLIEISDIKYMVYYGATSMLLPYEGKILKVYERLKNVPGLHVYLKEDIPEHYHIKHNRLTLPILLVASKNFYIKGLDIPGKSIPTGSSISLGSHGYDPYEVIDMRGIFFARGPGLKRNHTSEPLQMVDIYNILCGLLEIEPLPNNGTKTISKGIAALRYSKASLILNFSHKLSMCFSIISLAICYRYIASVT